MLDQLLNSSFVKTLIEIFFQILIVIANVVLYPFNVLIREFFPEFNDALENVTDLFEMASTYAGWALSLAGIPMVILVMVTGYFAFVITLSLSTWAVKIALKWIDTFA